MTPEARAAEDRELLSALAWMVVQHATEDDGITVRFTALSSDEVAVELLTDHGLITPRDGRSPQVNMAALDALDGIGHADGQPLDTHTP